MNRSRRAGNVEHWTYGRSPAEHPRTEVVNAKVSTTEFSADSRLVSFLPTTTIRIASSFESGD